MKRTLIILILFASTIPLGAVDQPWLWGVNDDFGPRLKSPNNFDYHEGIDFDNPNENVIETPIPSIEDGVITKIVTFGDFYNINVQGDSGEYLYGHIFSVNQHKFGQWEIFLNAILINPNTGSSTPNQRVIVLWENNVTTTTATKVLAIQDNRWIKIGDAILKNTSGANILSKNQVDQNEEIALIGNADANNVHLHLGLNYNDPPRSHPEILRRTMRAQAI